MIDIQAYNKIQNELGEAVTLVAVSKTKPIEDILSLYEVGQRDFGENYVQELVDKATALPTDLRWHFIGHLQSNKVKYIAPFVHLIHGVDSFKLLKEINKQGLKSNRVIDCLLQVHIAREETKFGLDEGELESILNAPEYKDLENVRVRGLMGMASFSDNAELIRSEFRFLHSLYNKWGPQQENPWSVLSMGMSSDYPLALEAGSTLVRIGSLLFGAREKKN